MFIESVLKSDYPVLQTVLLLEHFRKEYPLVIKTLPCSWVAVFLLWRQGRAWPCPHTAQSHPAVHGVGEQRKSVLLAGQCFCLFVCLLVYYPYGTGALEI